MSRIPATRLLLVQNGIVQGEFNSYLDIAYHLGISVNMDTGQITFMGREVNPSYMVKSDDVNTIGGEWESKSAILHNWVQHYMETYISKEYTIYRYLLT